MLISRLRMQALTPTTLQKYLFFTLFFTFHQKLKKCFCYISASSKLILLFQSTWQLYKLVLTKYWVNVCFVISHCDIREVFTFVK